MSPTSRSDSSRESLTSTLVRWHINITVLERKKGVQFEYISRAGVYISEVAHKSKRSQFGALQAVFLVIGIIAAQGRNSELFKRFSWDFFVFSPIFENGALSS